MNWLDRLRNLIGATPAEIPRLTLPLFPLGSVLFPGGILSLKVFEQRYLDMSAECLRRKPRSASA